MMNRSKSRLRSWVAAPILGLLPGLALAGSLAGCNDSGQPANPAVPSTTGGTTSATAGNPTPEQITNANPTSPSVPPAEGKTSTTGAASPSQDPGNAAAPAETQGGGTKPDVPKVIEKPAEPTPSDKGAEPK